MTDYSALLKAYDAHETRPERVDDLLAAAGLASLTKGASLDAVEDALHALSLSLNRANPLRRAAVRAGAILAVERAGVRAPAQLVDAALGAEAHDDTTLQGHALALRDFEPWPDPVDGETLLDELVQTFERFVVFPDQGATALALFTVHTHALGAALVSPLLALQSPQKRCGKSVALSVLAALVPRPLSASNITTAAIFRAIEAYWPTLLVDEADTFLRDNEKLRGVLNSGHLRTGTVIRTVGDDFEPRVFSTWGAKAIALIGELPATLADRAIRIVLRRRKPDERIERLRLDRLDGDLGSLRRQACRWAQDHLDALRVADPDVPPELDDRAADNWRPLLALADCAGGTWPERARHAALRLSVADEGEQAPGIQLLADIRGLFLARAADRLASADIVAALGAREDRPWSEWRAGRPITARQLARLLRPFGIRPRTVRAKEATFKGYVVGDLEDTFARYLTADPSHSEQSASDAEKWDSTIRHGEPGVTDPDWSEDQRGYSTVTDVTDQGEQPDGGPA